MLIIITTQQNQPLLTGKFSKKHIFALLLTACRMFSGDDYKNEKQYLPISNTDQEVLLIQANGLIATCLFQLLTWTAVCNCYRQTSPALEDRLNFLIAVTLRLPIMSLSARDQRKQSKRHNLKKHNRSCYINWVSKNHTPHNPAGFPWCQFSLMWNLKLNHPLKATDTGVLKNARDGQRHKTKQFLKHKREDSKREKRNAWVCWIIK